MSWKKAVFYGGAVLVLSACADTTAPTPTELTKLDRSSVSATKKTNFTAPEAIASDSTNRLMECTGMLIHVGGIETPLCPAPVIW